MPKSPYPSPSTASDSQTDTPPRFVIYARKSNDEGTGKQAESIPQQLEECFKYADHNDLILADRPQSNPYEEGIIEQIIAAFSGNPERAQILITRYIAHWVITEQKSAKTPFVRERWREVISKIQLKKISGLLTYNPDRCARNTQEGGELVQLWAVLRFGLKFTNALYENDAAGRMMLGFTFVLSEHYSGKLSEDTIRGVTARTEDGRAGGVRKLGYRIKGPDEDYFVPDPRNFPILKKAFHRKLYDLWSGTRIADEMNRAGWDQKLYRTSPAQMSARRISELNLWGDPFYYGVWERTFQHKVVRIDLQEITFPPGCEFKPLISEEEWFALQEILIDSRRRAMAVERSRKTHALELVTPIKSGLLTCGNCKTYLTFSVPNRHRHEKKLAALKEESPKATLADVVGAHQIHFECRNPGCDKTLKLTWKKIDAVLERFFGKVRVGETDYQAYLFALREKVSEKHREEKVEQKRRDLLFYRKRAEEEKWLQDTNFGQNLEGREKDLWETKKRKFKSDLANLTKDRTLLVNETRDYVFEQSAFLGLLRDIGSFWKKADYVRKREMCSIFFSNIVFCAGKPPQLRVFPELESLIYGLVAPLETISNHLLGRAMALPFQSARKIISAHREIVSPVINQPVPKVKRNLVILYGLENFNHSDKRPPLA